MIFNITACICGGFVELGMIALAIVTLGKFKRKKNHNGK